MSTSRGGAAGPPQRLSRAESRKLTRERLLEAAERVFAERGFHATRLEEVAEAAGYSKGAVYSNFSGKDDLFLAVLDNRQAREAPEWSNAPDAPTTLEGHVAAAERLFGVAQRDRTWSLLELEFALHALREPAARARLAERYRRTRVGIVAALEPLVGGDQARALSWALPALWTGLDLQVGVDPKAAPEGLLELILGHLMGFPNRT